MFGWKRKYRVLRQNYDRQVQVNDNLLCEKQRLEWKSKKLESLCDLAVDYQIIAIEKQNDSLFAVAMSAASNGEFDRTRLVYLFELPITAHNYWCGWKVRMSLDLYSNCSACIVDWHANPQNQGYGSILMKHLILYLRSSGFRSLNGSICPADFGHEEMLRHFYSKFGFEITDYPDRRRLHLNLLERENKAVHHDGHLVCCRTLEHGLLEMDQMLEQAEV